jgi:phosphoribosylformimino-5-aminoimidazole carboxamide ribotide isomerase
MFAEAPDDARALVERFGAKIIAGIDARGDVVATRGWLNETGISRDTLVATVAAWGVERVVYTEIARDGMGAGYDVAALAHVASLADVRITASGGARTLDDLLALRDGTPSNVDAAIVGRALYAGTLDLAEALAALA